jgi:methylamine dehydrogenase heavy chain
MQVLTRRGRGAALCALAFLAFAAGSARAELPVETLTLEKLAPADAYRIYLSDPAMPHLVDGRVHVIDGERMKYLGMTGTGFAPATLLSRDGKELFVATTYHARLQRGARTDVVEVWSTADLTLKYEIEVPPKHAQALPMRALLQQSADGRFLLIQNATPATSVTVVDLARRQVAGEFPNPGCWGVLPWRDAPTRFSSVCGDGTLLTFELSADGSQAQSRRSEKFFDADVDPLFMHFDTVGERYLFVSYGGQVHELTLAGDAPRFAAPWPLLDAAQRKAGWRPGGYALFALDPERQRLYVAMHRGAEEGRHKDPAQQLWVYDTQARRRVATMAGHAAVSMALARGPAPRLFLLSGADNTLISYDVKDGSRLKRPLARSAPMGETPVTLALP